MVGRKSRIEATLFMVAGALGFAWGLADHDMRLIGLAVTLICVAMYLVREIRQDITHAAACELANKRHAAERARLEGSN